MGLVEAPPPRLGRLGGGAVFPVSFCRLFEVRRLLWSGDSGPGGLVWPLGLPCRGRVGVLLAILAATQLAQTRNWQSRIQKEVRKNLIYNK